MPLTNSPPATHITTSIFGKIRIGGSVVIGYGFAVQIAGWAYRPTREKESLFMTMIANGQIVVTHDELAGKKPDGFAVYVRSTIKAGHREGEPVLYIELEAESNGTRMLFALSSPRLVAQIANSGIRVGGAYHMRVSGSSVAPNVTFEPLPATGPFPSDAAEPLRLDAEDVGVVAGVIARRTRHRIETITGMDFTEIDQALTATILISQLRDRSGIIRPTIAKEILEEERRMSTNERRTA